MAADLLNVFYHMEHQPWGVVLWNISSKKNTVIASEIK